MLEQYLIQLMDRLSMDHPTQPEAYSNELMVRSIFEGGVPWPLADVFRMQMLGVWTHGMTVHVTNWRAQYGLV